MNAKTIKSISKEPVVVDESKAVTAYAFVYYDIQLGQAGGIAPWRAGLTLYSNPKQDDDSIISTRNGTFESLGDALVWVSNTVRARHLDTAQIEVRAYGQPPVARYGGHGTQEQYN